MTKGKKALRIVNDLVKELGYGLDDYGYIYTLIKGAQPERQPVTQKQFENFVNHYNKMTVARFEMLLDYLGLEILEMQKHEKIAKKNK